MHSHCVFWSADWNTKQTCEEEVFGGCSEGGDYLGTDLRLYSDLCKSPF